jgi:hypothetical protein
MAEEWPAELGRPVVAGRVDASMPNVARVWNYLAGGRENFEADRAAARKLVSAAAAFANVVPASRAFRDRLVGYLMAEAGIRQFIDVGAGMPTARNTHEVAQALDPACRVVYVDNDPLLITHARASLRSSKEGAVRYVDADARDPAHIFAAAADILDYSEPFAILMINFLDLPSDASEIRSILAEFMAASSLGSYLAIAQLASDLDPAVTAAAQRWDQVFGAPLTLRSREEVTGLADGLELVAPGVVPVSEWHPGELAHQPGAAGTKAGETVPVYGVVARKPQARAALRADETAALSSARAAATAETRIYSLISARRFDDAQAAINDLATANPGATETGRLLRELGFLSLAEPDRHLLALAWRAAGAGHEERLSTDAREPVPEAAEASDDASPAVLAPQAPGTRPPQSSQQLGTILEKATDALFQHMFAVQAPGSLLRLRRQPTGTQFGHDLEFDLAEAGKTVVRCHVECKNLDNVVPTKDVAEKLMQQEFHHRDAPPDHWILISPRHDISSELRTMLPVWEKEGRYPFGIQVWSPETGVRVWFALEPAIYEEVYGHPPTPEEIAEAGAVAARYMMQLTPRIRVAPAWRGYLENPKLICANGEPWQHFNELYQAHLPLQAADERGALLDGTLMDRVMAWARDEADRQPRLLLADFGEGKSLFTYCLTRQLAEEFRAAPVTGVFPLRVPLKDFSQAGSARALLEDRLKYIGASYADWNVLAGQVRTLVILDGFDEMSADLSSAALEQNLKNIEACVEEFPDSKVLVTSRERVLDGANARRRTLDRLGKPVELHIAAGSRRQRVEYLEGFAAGPVLAARLAALRDLYDPIGLAAKPLFLQMIKVTLLTGNLPLTDFSEQALYRSYIDQSLRLKHKLLRDPGGQLTEDDLVRNLQAILEDVAVKLHEGNAPHVYLQDYQRTPRERRLAGMLWQMSGQEEAAPADLLQKDEDDVVNRVRVRSLLKQVAAPDPGKWPVDFFHRSMREYFVALAIARSLGEGARDLERARRLLRASPLLPEIAHFAASILKTAPDQASALDTLESLARSATLSSGEKYLGGNAVTLLHAAAGRLPHGDWPRLCLDHADLHGADLHDMNFARSSLRYANLDNANLERTDLTEANLEGVRLEETSRVLSVVAGTARIIAGYEDHTLREWRPAPGGKWANRVLATLDHRPERLNLTPLGRIVATGDDFLTVLDAGGTLDDSPGTAPADGLKEWCQFRTRSRVQAIVLDKQMALLAEEADGGVWVFCLDAATGRVIDEYGAHGAVTAYALADGNMYGVAATMETYLAQVTGGANQWGGSLEDRKVTCLALQAKPSGILLASGHQDGTVSLIRLLLDDLGDDDARGWHESLLWEHPLHDGPVNTIAFTTEDQVISGGADRSVRVTRVEPPRSGQPPVSAEPLRLTFRCRGVRCDDVSPAHTQQKLRRLSAQEA